MRKRLAFLALGTVLLSGCSAPGAAVVTPKAAQRATAQSADADVLRRDIEQGFKQIFEHYDTNPRDGRLAWGEFGHIVSDEWFIAHDTDKDGYIPLGEWLTPAEMTYQLGSIVTSGRDLVTRADRDGDAALTLDEYLAYTPFVIDATPWLAGPADRDVKANGFKRAAGPSGRLTADTAALMLGDLLAYGYYLDDESEPTRLGLPQSRIPR